MLLSIGVSFWKMEVIFKYKIEGLAPFFVKIVTLDAFGED